MLHSNINSHNQPKFIQYYVKITLLAVNRKLGNNHL